MKNAVIKDIADYEIIKLNASYGFRESTDRKRRDINTTINDDAPSMTHELKTDSEVFDDVFNKKKTYEIRKNDRNFRVGDKLYLRETVYTGEEMKARHNGSYPGEMVPGKPIEYTGREITVTVSHVLHGPIYGLVIGWCILSIAPKHY